MKYTNDEVTNRVIRKIIDRQKAGFEEYGSTLADNKSDIIRWLKDIQEELIDASQYIEKIIFDLEKYQQLWQSNEHKDTHSKDGQSNG